MGLDMFLYKHRKNDVNNNGRMEIGYWRKANHIHNWFIRNIQKGVDDQGDYVVSKKKLTDLLDICLRILFKESIDIKALNESIKRNKLIKYNNICSEIKTRLDNLKESLPSIRRYNKLIDITLAKKELPTMAGFFFGEQDYEWDYVDKTIDTCVILMEAIEYKIVNGKEDVITYSSWW